jgi:hypothetical protein
MGDYLFSTEFKLRQFLINITDKTVRKDLTFQGQHGQKP